MLHKVIRSSPSKRNSKCHKKMRILKSAVQSLPAPFMSMSLPDKHQEHGLEITTHESATTTNLTRLCITHSSNAPPLPRVKPIKQNNLRISCNNSLVVKFCIKRGKIDGGLKGLQTSRMKADVRRDVVNTTSQHSPRILFRLVLFHLQHGYEPLGGLPF